MTTTVQRETAAERYRANLSEVERLAAAIIAKLKADVDGLEDRQIHWGHVGDGGAVLALFRDAADFLGADDD